MTGTRDALTHKHHKEGKKLKPECARAEERKKRKNDHKITTYNRRNHTFRIST